MLLKSLLASLCLECPKNPEELLAKATQHSNGTRNKLRFGTRVLAQI